MKGFLPVLAAALLVAVGFTASAGQYNRALPQSEVRAVSSDGKYSIPVRLFNDTQNYRPSLVTEYNGSSLTQLDTAATYFVYDAKSRIQSLTRWVRSYTGVWGAVQRDTFSYDEVLSVNTFTHQYWSPLNTWANDAMTEHTFDANNLETQAWQKTWDLEHATWKDGSKFKYEYDQQGRLSRIVLSNPLGYGYWDALRSTITYNDKSQVDSIVAQTVGFAGTTNSVKNTFRYDAKGRVLTAVTYAWQSNAWFSTDSTDYLYDDVAYQVSATSASRNVYSPEWTFTGKTVDTYDGAGHILTTVVWGYDSFNKVWIQGSSLTYHYNDAFNHVRIEAYYYDGSAWVRGQYSLQIPYNGGSNTLSTNFMVLDMDFIAGATAVKAEIETVPTEYALGNNYPNPFNPSTRISFSLPKASMVRIAVYNALGTMVGTAYEGAAPAGVHEVGFNASGLASGAYFYRLEARAIDGQGQYQASRKMLLVK